MSPSPEGTMIRNTVVAVLLVSLAACMSATEPQKMSPSAKANLSSSGGDGGSCTLANGYVTTTGRDQYGYNRCASTFNAAADGVDKILDGMVWGDPTYANDHLIMKWNAEWDRGNAEGWSKPPYAAWLSNEWNGNRANGSGYTEHFKTKWYGACVDNSVLPSGGTCIWSQFEVLMDQGTVPGGGHVWWTKAIPNGYGH